MRRVFSVALALTTAFTLGSGMASAQEVHSDIPSTPAKITVNPKPKPFPELQPPVELTVYAQPYGRVPQGKSLMNYAGPITAMSPALKNYVETQSPAWIHGQPSRYSLFYKDKKTCTTALDAGYSRVSGLDSINFLHWIWSIQHDFTGTMVNQCYQIFNGMWVYEYINYFELPSVKNPQSLPGRYVKDVPPSQRKYLRK